jgi:hypothetical protein
MTLRPLPQLDANHWCSFTCSIARPRRRVCCSHLLIAPRSNSLGGVAGIFQASAGGCVRACRVASSGRGHPRNWRSPQRLFDSEKCQSHGPGNPYRNDADDALWAAAVGVGNRPHPPKCSLSTSTKWRTRSFAPTDGSSLCQPAPVRTHFASVVRQHLSRGAVSRKA